MNQIINQLSGVKTYMTAIAAILTTIVAYLNHTIDGKDAIAAIIMAIQTMNLRHAITTTLKAKTP